MYRFQIFLVNDEYLRSLQRYIDQAKPRQLKILFANICTQSLHVIWRPGFIFYWTDFSIALSPLEFFLSPTRETISS